ncbi:3-oxoacyl-[acyl-carrier-protein] synthase III C-terminal domain-containing protein [Streptomyces sp. NPDC001415]
MTSLTAVSTYLPKSVPIAELAEQSAVDEAQVKRFQRFYGLSAVCRSPRRREDELLLAAASGLDALRGREDRVRYVIQARTFVSSSPDPTSSLRRVAEELGLRRAAVLSVTQQACASGMQAVDTARTLLAADGDPEAFALVLTGEKTFTPAARGVPRSNIGGEGAAAVLVRLGGARDGDRILGYASRTLGRFYDDVITGEESPAEFNKAYPGALAEVMRAACEEAGISFDDVDLVIPHNVNTISWRGVSGEVGIPMERIFLDNIPVTGHCFAADPFINYGTAAQRGLLRPGSCYLLTAVGLGATFSAMVVQR